MGDTSASTRPSAARVSGEVLTGDIPDALDQAIRAHWQAWCG
jgi:hypothetical protein